MASEVKTNKISPATSTTVTLGDALDVFQLPASAEIDIASGATLDVNGTIDVTGATTTGFPSGGFHQLRVFTTSTSAGGYSPDTDVTKLIVAVQGGGGSGGYGSGAGYGSGGSAGGYSLKYLTGVSSSDTMTITVGSGGAINGNVGNDTKFTSVSGTSFTEVKGAGGGAGAHNGGNAVGGLGSGGDVQIQGQRGGYQTGNVNYGGSSPLGMGSLYQGATSTVDNSTGFGAGGHGGYAVSSADGAAGRDGIVIVWEYK